MANDSTVIVYDVGEGTSAATLWWAMRRYGHEDVRLLNGGLFGVADGGRETTSRAHVRPDDLCHQRTAPVAGHVDRCEAGNRRPMIFIVDARPFGYFTGDIAHAATPTIGHIPGAHHAGALALTPGQKTIPYRRAACHDLRSMEITPAQRGITYCGNGHLAAFGAFLLYLMGFENVAVYDQLVDGIWRDAGHADRNRLQPGLGL